MTTEARTSNRSAAVNARGVALCPKCGRETGLLPEEDGIGRPTDRLRMLPHAGNQWGRMCKASGELWEPRS